MDCKDGVCTFDESTLKVVKGEDEGDVNLFLLSNKGIQDRIFNGLLSENQRLKALSEYTYRNKEESIEVLQRLLGMYTFSHTTVLEKLISTLCMKSDDDVIPILKKYDCAQYLYNGSYTLNVCDELFTNLHEKMGEEGINPVIRYELVIFLCSLYYFNVDDHKDTKDVDGRLDNVLENVSDIMNDEDIECDKRYHYLRGLDKESLKIPGSWVDEEYRKEMDDNEEVLYQHTHQKNGDDTYTINKDTTEFREWLHDTLEKDKQLLPLTFILKTFHRFLEEDNEVLYKILSCQYLLQQYTSHSAPHSSAHSAPTTDNILEEKDSLKIQDVLMGIAENDEGVYNQRADAADVLLMLGSGHYKELAQYMIMQLGELNPEFNDGARTIYGDKQNVHKVTSQIHVNLIKIYNLGKSLSSKTYTYAEIENRIKGKYIKNSIHILKDLEYKVTYNDLIDLQAIFGETMKLDDTTMEELDTNNDISEKTKQILKDLIELQQNKTRELNVSLTRIKNDNMLYDVIDDGKISLQDVFIYIWKIIEYYTQYTDELESIVIDELQSMADTCSSGHISRLVNILSGYTFTNMGKTIDFTVKISFEDQICANVYGRLRKMIQELEDDDYKDKIIEQMMGNTTDSERKEYNEFFIKSFILIKEELFTEFVTGNYIEKSEFEGHITTAIKRYQGGH
jgi:hypothetical protein